MSNRPQTRVEIKEEKKKNNKNIFFLNFSYVLPEHPKFYTITGCTLVPFAIFGVGPNPFTVDLFIPANNK